MEEEPQGAEEDRMEDDSWDGSLRRLAKTMPPDLRREVNELLQLYALNGVRDAAANRAVAELYSPPRVTAELKRRHRHVPGMALVPGATFDLEEDENGESYDVLKAVDRQRIRDRVLRDEPFVVVGSPKCTDYSSLTVNLQHPKMTEVELRRRLVEREVMLRFAVEIYCLQLAGGRHFLHEHPRGALSWEEPFMRDLLRDPRVGTVVADQCRFGLRIPGPGGRPTLARKPTQFASSAPAILEELDLRCQGGHEHQAIRGGSQRSRLSAVYPAALCRAILRGAENQRRRDGLPVPAGVRQLLAAGLGVFELRREQQNTGESRTEPGCHPDAHSAAGLNSASASFTPPECPPTDKKGPGGPETPQEASAIQGCFKGMASLSVVGKASGVQTVRAVVDSGASESVTPPGVFTAPVLPSRMSMAGETYTAANGSAIANLGRTTVPYRTAEGSKMTMHFQVGEGLTQPLVSVAGLVDSGNWVAFDRTGGWIHQVSTGRRVRIPRIGNTFYLDMKVAGNPEEEEEEGAQRSSENEEAAPAAFRRPE